MPERAILPRPWIACMFPDIVDLRSFYAQPLGHVARRLMNRSVRGRWADTRGMAVMGLGYATPYLGVFREEVERTFAFMPAAQGVVKWPSAAPSLTSLVHETLLPLPDASVDRVFAIDRKSTRLNSSHVKSSYAVLCLK